MTSCMTFQVDMLDIMKSLKACSKELLVILLVLNSSASMDANEKQPFQVEPMDKISYYGPNHQVSSVCAPPIGNKGGFSF